MKKLGGAFAFAFALAAAACGGGHSSPEALVEALYERIAAGDAAGAAELWGSQGKSAEGFLVGGLVAAMMKEEVERIQARGGFLDVSIERQEGDEDGMVRVGAVERYPGGQKETIYWFVTEGDDGWRITDFDDAPLGRQFDDRTTDPAMEMPANISEDATWGDEPDRWDTDPAVELAPNPAPPAEDPWID